MITWSNVDSLSAWKKLLSLKGMVSVAAELSGASASKRIREYSVPMAEGLTFNYGAKQVNEQILTALSELSAEAELLEKFEALYNGEVVNTGEKRKVLHHLLRGQLGKDVQADGVNKRDFYLSEQKRIADFAQKIHDGKIVNEKGETFTSVCQIGIGGSDLGPRAMYLALENWAKANGTFKMEAHFISNVDPDDGAGVIASLDIARTIFILVSKSGTTLETLTNESFVKDFIKKGDKSVLMTTHIVNDLDGLLNELIIMRKNHKPLQIGFDEFMTTFKGFSLNKDVDIKGIKGIQSVLELSDQKQIFGFFKDEIPCSKEINLSFEDAFLGLTGRY